MTHTAKINSREIFAFAQPRKLIPAKISSIKAVNILLYGRENSSDNTNTEILNSTITFLIASKRFDN